VTAGKRICRSLLIRRKRNTLLQRAPFSPPDMRSSSSSPPASAHHFGLGGGVTGSISNMSADSGNCSTRGGAGSPPASVATHQTASAPGSAGSMSNSTNTQSIADYLAQLLKDKKALAAFPNVFLHLERLLDDEIGKVRGNLFQINGKKTEPLVLPDASGTPINLSEKVYVPIKEYPDFNFVGRILGPRGMTTKQLEQETGCKIMVRGKGSMRDKKKEDQNRGKPNWEHLNDELHVLITVEDAENRASMKLQRAVDEVKKLLTVSDGEDELKKRQLMELAIINGTYRDSQSKSCPSPGLDGNSRYLAAAAAAAAAAAGQPMSLQSMVTQHHQHHQLRAAAAAAAAAAGGTHLGGAPLILSPRLAPHLQGQHGQPGTGAGHHPPTSVALTGNMAAAAAAAVLNGSGTGAPPPLIAPGDTTGLLYAQYAAAAAAAENYANYSAATTGLVSPLLSAADYQSTADPSGTAVAAAAAAAAFAAGGANATGSNITAGVGAGGKAERGRQSHYNGQATGASGGITSQSSQAVRPHPYNRS